MNASALAFLLGRNLELQKEKEQAEKSEVERKREAKEGKQAKALKGWDEEALKFNAKQRRYAVFLRERDLVLLVCHASRVLLVVRFRLEEEEEKVEEKKDEAVTAKLLFLMSLHVVPALLAHGNLVTLSSCSLFLAVCRPLLMRRYTEAFGRISHGFCMKGLSVA